MDAAMLPTVTAAQYAADRAITVECAEEVSLFAARRAVVAGQFSPAFVATLRQLCQSERQAIRNHAIHLAHKAAAIEWTRRQNGAA